MNHVRLLICTLGATAIFAQSNELATRLTTLLGAGDAAAKAKALLAQHNFAAVEEMLTAILPQAKPRESEILALRADIEFLNGKVSLAAKDFSQSSSLAPLNDADIFTFAMALVKLHDEEHARPLLAGLVQRSPTSALYLYWLGRLDYSQRRYQEAVEKLRKAAALDPASPRIWDSLGLALDMQSLSDQALEAFRRADSLNRQSSKPSPWPPHDLGSLLLRTGQWKEAEQSFREALRYDPDLPQAHYHLGRALEKQSLDAEAITEYCRAVSLDATSSDALYSLAMLYRRLHRDADSERAFAEYRRRKQSASPESANQ